MYGNKKYKDLKCDVLEPFDYRMPQDSVTDGHACLGYTLHKHIIRMTIAACAASANQAAAANN